MARRLKSYEVDEVADRRYGRVQVFLDRTSKDFFA